MNESLTQIARALALAEARLFDEVSLAAMAAAAGVSPWHFHRLFVAITGETPAGYVRRRRLSEICRRLIETDQPLVEVALDTGFESQATFTRAFTHHVGTSPGRYRQQKLCAAAHRYGPLDTAALAARLRSEGMEPRLVRRPTFYVVGMSGHFTPATNSRIPELWARFARRIGDVPERQGFHTLGVCIGAAPDGDEAGFTYVAGVEVAGHGAVPDGMVAITVPARTYAVYTHRGHISRLHDTVKRIWGHWLPASPYRTVAAPDFEWYDARFDVATGEGEVDVYVPIAEPR